MLFRHLARSFAAAALAIGLAAPASAQVFFYPPTTPSDPVTGGEPGLFVPAMTGPTAADTRAQLVWNLRSALNVAALNCQYWPFAMTVRNYNDMLKHHAAELNDAHEGLKTYFRRTAGDDWQQAMDEYTTTMYQSYIRIGTQRAFCHVASDVTREALSRPKGQLHLTAAARMRAVRGAMQPTQDLLLPVRATIATPPLPNLAEACWDEGEYDVERCS